MIGGNCANFEEEEEEMRFERPGLGDFEEGKREIGNLSTPSFASGQRKQGQVFIQRCSVHPT